MALSANQNVETKGRNAAVEHDAPMASGAIEVFRGAILNYNSSGYAKLGGDTASETFAGIAVEHLDQASGGSNADNSIRVLPRGCGAWVKLTVTSSITVANIGATVCVDGDDAVDLASATTNDVNVGTIREIVDANTAWVQLDQ